nr:PREDICTED: cilia- and flagella-associated protein 58-like [Bemisia tabaci]
MITERDVLNSQLMKKTEEVEAANKKIESLQDSLQNGETQYTMRLDDIRLLKLEVVKLRSEKTALRRSLASLADSRQHIFNLERDLAKERVKCRALEEELQNPLNIHRWRKLEGSDPECYQLINKMQLLQKRVLSKTSEVVEKEEQLKEAEELYADLKTMLSRRPPPDLQDKFKAVQLQIQQKNRKIQALTGQLEAAEAQASEYKVEVERCRIELDSFKKKYYQQKHNIGKLRQKSMDDSSSALSTNLAEKLRHELEKPKSSRGAKIAGGGFSMILTPPRTVNKSSTISRIK